jgi:uncharacterized membrane protein
MNNTNHQESMDAEQIIVLAQQQVRSRRIYDAQRRWSGPSRFLLPGLVLAALVAFGAAPGRPPEKFLWLMGGVCGLRPGHSYFAGHIQLPVESRMVGIYGGFFVTFALLLATRRFGARQLGTRHSWSILAVMFATMVFDGVNSTLMEFDKPHLYTTTNATRLATGLLSGIAIATVLLWLLNGVLRPREWVARRAIIHSSRYLGLLIAANVAFAAAVVSGHPWLYYPLAVINIGGIVIILASVALMIVAIASEINGRVVLLRQLVVPGSLALLLAFAVLVGAASLRWSITGPGEPHLSQHHTHT